MANPERKIISLIALIVGALLFNWAIRQPVRITFSTSGAADCIINALNWDKSQAVIGETVAMQAVGTSGCLGKSLSLKIYEEDRGATDDVIVIVPSSFAGNGTGFARYQFSQADYEQGGNESGDEIMYFTAIVDGQEISGKESASLHLIRPTGGGEDCQISRARWNTTTRNAPIVGSYVQLLVDGSGCANRPVSLTIWEQDNIRNDKIVDLTANFNAGGKQAITTWQIADLEAGDGYGSFEFFFRAGLKVGENLAESNKLLVPVNSATGCVNCNVGAIQPSVCQCYDGTNIKREPLQSCKALCQTHIGDAHDPSGGGGNGGGGGGGGGTPGQPISFKFKLTNYLIGDPKDIGGVLGLLGRFVFNLGIPLAVIVIIYGGLIMLTSGGNPNQYKKGLEALKYATIGLAVLLVGKGFVSLVQSILSIK